MLSSISTMQVGTEHGFEQNPHQIGFVAHHIHLCFLARMSDESYWLHTPDQKV